MRIEKPNPFTVVPAPSRLQDASVVLTQKGVYARTPRKERGSGNARRNEKLFLATLALEVLERCPGRKRGNPFGLELAQEQLIDVLLFEGNDVLVGARAF